VRGRCARGRCERGRSAGGGQCEGPLLLAYRALLIVNNAAKIVNKTLL
jgi:hypothetical protein